MARLRPAALGVKMAWKLCVNTQLAARFLFYKALPGVFFQRLGSGTRIYGSLRFGNVPSHILVGRNCMLGAGLFLSASDDAHIRIGDNCSINTGCHLVAVSGIDIGDGTMIGEYVSIRDQNHNFADAQLEIREQGFVSKPIRIGKDVWIGRGVFIGSGIEIGDGCIIGANSVVTKSLPPYSVAVGSPARVVKSR